ncbi:hypothetical protein T492DRAFT_964835 [Pavlovales sp. CCMP2436]|nr:hypothetical protein T492DRAFT_964835 [Pavlovales sp. CCMP2436]|mmetsp:Transcript_42428/g.104496  ORF Transcript_42428/g.104496 Transcript_42428/m.104496 type:complete len:208 (+) Transcript_42428:104-727(+)
MELPRSRPVAGTKAPDGNKPTNVYAEVARDMLNFAEAHRAEMLPADFAAMDRWRSYAAVQCCTWGFVTSAVAYGGARLGRPSGPLPFASKAITAGAFLFGAAVVLPSTAPHLISDVQTLNTPFGEVVRKSFLAHSAGGAQHGSVSLQVPQQPGASPVTDGESYLEASPSLLDALSAPPVAQRPSASPTAVNEWGDPVFVDGSSERQA